MRPSSPIVEASAIRPVPPGQVTRAIELVVASPQMRETLRAQQIRAFVDYANSPAVRSTRHVGAYTDGQMVCACLCYVHADCTGMLFVPSIDERPEIGAHAHDLLAWQRRHSPNEQIRLLQLMCETNCPRTEGVIASAGYHRLADLHYLQCRVRRGDGAAGPTNTRWMAFSAEAARMFEETLESTYVDSLDCPALAGVRKIEDIILGHRHVGRFEAGLWQVLVARDGPAAVLIGACHDEQRAMEVVYMGVVPAWRGRGLGSLLLRRANELALERRMQTLTLAVDGGNEPAMRTYLRFGFAHRTTRRAFIALPESQRGGGAP